MIYRVTIIQRVPFENTFKDHVVTQCTTSVMPFEGYYLNLSIGGAKIVLYAKKAWPPRDDKEDVCVLI